MTKNPNKTLVISDPAKILIIKQLTEKYLHLIPKEEKPATDKPA